MLMMTFMSHALYRFSFVNVKNKVYFGLNLQIYGHLKKKNYWLIMQLKEVFTIQK